MAKEATDVERHPCVSPPMTPELEGPATRLIEEMMQAAPCVWAEELQPNPRSTLGGAKDQDTCKLELHDRNSKVLGVHPNIPTQPLPFRVKSGLLHSQPFISLTPWLDTVLQE